MSYRLFLDDERAIEDCENYLGDPMYDTTVDDWVICRKSADALDTVRKKGLPTFMALDHDLGLDDDYNLDTTMKFLHALVELVGAETPPPEYSVHSMNAVGRMNIVSFMMSWKHVSRS